jgi:hypothetical protein
MRAYTIVQALTLSVSLGTLSAVAHSLPTKHEAFDAKPELNVPNTTPGEHLGTSSLSPYPRCDHMSLS